MREKLITEVCNRYEIAPEEIIKKKQRGKVNEARQVGMLAAWMSLTKSKVIIAGWFGLSKPGSATSMIENAKDRYDTDKTFRGQVDYIIKQMA